MNNSFYGDIPIRNEHAHLFVSNPKKIPSDAYNQVVITLLKLFLPKLGDFFDQLSEEQINFFEVFHFFPGNVPLNTWNAVSINLMKNFRFARSMKCDKKPHPFSKKSEIKITLSFDFTECWNWSSTLKHGSNISSESENDSFFLKEYFTKEKSLTFPFPSESWKGPNGYYPIHILFFQTQDFSGPPSWLFAPRGRSRTL